MAQPIGSARCNPRLCLRIADGVRPKSPESNCQEAAKRCQYSDHASASLAVRRHRMKTSTVPAAATKVMAI